MAYRRRRNARPKRKAESPEMRTSSVRNLTFATYRRFPQAMQDRFLDGYHSAKDALSEGAVSRAPDSPKGWREAIYNWLRLHGDEREQLYMDEPNKQGQAFRRGVKETAELAHSQHDPSASSDWGERFNPSTRRRKNVSSKQASADFSWVKDGPDILYLRGGRLGDIGSVEKKGAKWMVYDEDGERPIAQEYTLEDAQDALLDHLDIADSNVRQEGVITGKNFEVEIDGPIDGQWAVKIWDLKKDQIAFDGDWVHNSHQAARNYALRWVKMPASKRPSDSWDERSNPSARQRKKAKKWTIYHADHGINTKQMAYIKKYVQKSAPQGFFIKQWRFPRSQGLGTVYNAMWGPESGDRAVPESQVHYKARGDRDWTDRMIDRPPRPVNYGQVLGIRDGDSFTLFTVYGGPLAPLNPADPDNQDVAGSKKFWKKHALSSHQWNPRGRALHVPEDVMARAERAGVSRKVVARIASRKESAWEVLPSSLSGMKKRGKTYYLPVQTGYNTDWEYTISKTANGWVARFKPKRRGAQGYYLGDGGSQHRDPDYFRTAKSAFVDAIAPHAMSGEYLKYRNPKKRHTKRHTKLTGGKKEWFVHPPGGNPKRRRNISLEPHHRQFGSKSHQQAEAREEAALAMRIHNDLGISLKEAWAMVRREGVYNLLSRGY